MERNGWAAQVVGREEDGYFWGDTRDAAIDDAVEREIDRRDCDGDDPGPIELVVHGGCTWDEIPDDERDSDCRWTHWLSGWTSTERVTVEAP